MDTYIVHHGVGASSVPIFLCPTAAGVDEDGWRSIWVGRAVWPTHLVRSVWFGELSLSIDSRALALTDRVACADK